MLILLRGSLPTTGNQPTTFTSGLRGLRSSKRLPLGHLTGSAVGQESSEDASAWSVREMRAFLDERGMRHADCFEKRELLDRVQRALVSGETPTTTPDSGPATPAAAPAATAATAATVPGPTRTRKGDGPPHQFPEFGEVVTVPSLEVEAGSFIFLHGFGDSARGFVSQLPNLLQLPALRYILPTAPSRGGVMRSWFGSVGGAEDTRTMDYVHHLIRVELARGVQAKRVFVGGFSQGGCVAVNAALSFPDTALGGCIAASTFLSPPGVAVGLGLTIAEANRRLPVLCCHGDADPAVPLASGEALVKALRERGVPTELRIYPRMGHAYCPGEAADVASFLQKRMLLAEGAMGLQQLSARRLKSLLQEMGVSTVGCFDKDDFLERAVQAGV